MFRRFFKIGFGGCGCALEEHFRSHAVYLTCELLKTHYLKDLKGWKNGLPPDHKFGIAHTVDMLDSMLNKELTDITFNEKLDKIAAELRSWQIYSEIVEKTGKRYEDVILEDIRDIVKTMEKEVEDTKYRGSVLFESLPVDSFTETEAKGKSERFYVYNQNITETRELIVDQFGQVVIESQGFNHQPELQMLPFSIKEVRDEVFKKITSTIETRRLKDSATGGFLFFVGLGGGTGTGVISPLAEKFGKGSLGYFTVAVLGGEADDEVLQSQKPWFRRCFNMLIALNDLIVTAELDGIILVDNDVIMSPEEKKGKSGPALMAEIDEKIIEKLYPAFGITVLDGNDLDWSQLKEPIGLHTLKKKPPVIVPCYASGDCSKSEDNLEHLIEEALKDKDSNNGKLARCEHIEKAERVFVYVRCIKDEDTLREKLAEKFAPDKVKSEEKLIKEFATNNIAILKDYLFCWDKVNKDNYEELKSSLKNVCEIGWVDNAAKGDQNEDKLELYNPSDKNEKIIIEIGEERELFNWDDVVKRNYGKLENYLEDCKIKFDLISMPDDKTITISKSQQVIATITLNEEENKATLKGDNKGNKEKRELKVKKEKEKRKIYTPQEAELFTGKYLFNWDDVVRKKQNLDELKEYLEVCKIEFDSTSMPNDKTITISKSQQVIATITLNEEENKATCDWDKENELKVKDRRIYDYLRKNGNKKVEYPELKVETVKGKRYVYLKKCQATRTWIKNNLKKDIVVFESQEIGSFWHEREKKKNEVLILLFNPDVKEALSDRLLEAKKFVDLVVRFKEVIEDRAKEGSKDKLEIAGQIIGQINKEQTVDADLNKKLKAIKLKEGIEEKDKPLPQAKIFLFPEELYDKDKEIYDRMVEILDRLKSEVGRIPEEGEDGDWWPIFRENIFNIISTSGKRDEVILSAIEALEDQDKFNRLVGERVYNTYFETFKREYFKYKACYLYSGVGEPILSDDAEKELPVALKEELDKEKERIEGAKLKGLVKEYTSVMNGHAGTPDGTELSYPAMLAVAGLYAEWEQVGSWESFNPAEDKYKDKIFEKLFKKENAPTSGDFEIYVFSKERVEGNRLDKLDKRNLLIIDTDKEDATLVIREADKDFFPQVDKDEVPKSSIPQKLVDMFKESGIEYVNNKNYEVKDRKLEPRPEAITNNKLYRCYYIKEKAGKYSIDGDQIHNTLKVKKEEGKDGKTLKIYKKRGDKFEAAE